MSSIIEGYNYDIFISYRQKDNKHDGWVTEFVNNLKGELESTFKEEISVYFDINSHDGLLETHDVDASLKEKLKCLVFIPIISRTYCDPKSFAWEHEFKAFVETASKDQCGLKVKLPNGNVASRVLPIRIHDLDADDIKECESVLGGVLRGVEFIYKELGIDKPLAPDDDEKKNLNNTKYRIQIIKVSHAIKEIISGLKAEPTKLAKAKILQREPEKEVKIEDRKETQGKSIRSAISKLFPVILIITILMIAAIIAYPKIFKRDTLERLRSSGERISVAVMPFQNMTNDTTWNIWQDGIQDMLVTWLSNNPEELSVKHPESVKSLIQGKGIMNHASLTPSIARTVSRKLNADIFINGSIIQSGSKLILNAQLIDSKTEEILKPFQIEGPSIIDSILILCNSLSAQINNFLIIKKFNSELSPEFQSVSTNYPEALRYLITGGRFNRVLDYPTAKYWYLRAYEIDTNYYDAIIALSWAYQNTGMYEEAKKMVS